jgi:hypothetical protein
VTYAPITESRRISNGADIRAAYNDMGHVKPGNIVLQETVV